MRMAASRGLSQGLPASNRIVRGGYYSRDNNEFAYFSVVRQNIGEFTFFAEVWIYHTGQEKMIKTISLSMCLAASSLSLNARAQDERAYTEGPVTEVDYIQVEYGRFETYIDWLNSTWKPTMEATKKAGLIIDYKVFRLTPKLPDQPNIILWITYKNAAAALDKGVELEAVAKKVICSTECQNKARVARSEYRKVLGNEYIRELILK
jgi:hypothetical protein